MNEPPDYGGTFKQSNFIDKAKILKFTTTGSKYLVMSSMKSGEILYKVSPFFIKKVVVSVCAGEVISCKKLRNGTILIKIKNVSQAAKLVQFYSQLTKLFEMCDLF